MFFFFLLIRCGCLFSGLCGGGGGGGGGGVVEKSNHDQPIITHFQTSDASKRYETGTYWKRMLLVVLPGDILAASKSPFSLPPLVQ